MDIRERTRLDAYFAHVAREFTMPEPPPSAVLVTPLLPEHPPFVRAVGAVSRLRAVLPGPDPADGLAHREVERAFAVDELARDRLADPDTAVTYLEARAAGERVVLLDAGGRFAPSLDALCERFSGTVLGVVESTGGGHDRYAARTALPCPVVSVARSPLREPENYLAGHSMVSSAEDLLRGRGDSPHGIRALLLGFGGPGGHAARLLRGRGVRVTVHDTDPVGRTRALAQGFGVVEDRDRALGAAGLVLCSTGAHRLGGEEAAGLRNGTLVALLSAPEGGQGPYAPPEGYARYGAARHITRYERAGHHFYVLDASGVTAAPRGARARRFRTLVQAEAIAGLRALARDGLEPALHEVPAADRAGIAGVWLYHFGDR
ncbi:adenosylhomocysteinase [Streptomyces sp. SHP 1-2]|uniref:adenosylhomocysteinase n=1 Tax=Streptomyces sp. SHP 1-2 TaxID=2769489 RepID=UPI002239124A|nr:adenosylhomocysteinase [Streptomyces sp. SHP 1-2]MCW5249097.1 adenosylhomocysteinase [Streptomyces sp. SHP 1-2]